MGLFSISLNSPELQPNPLYLYCLFSGYEMGLPLRVGAGRDDADRCPVQRPLQPLHERVGAQGPRGGDGRRLPAHRAADGRADGAVWRRRGHQLHEHRHGPHRQLQSHAARHLESPLAGTHDDILSALHSEQPTYHFYVRIRTYQANNLITHFRSPSPCTSCTAKLVSPASSASPSPSS